MTSLITINDIITIMDYFSLWHDVFTLLDFRSQLSFTLSKRIIHDSFFITDLYNINDKYIKKIDEDILQKIFYRASLLKVNDRIRNVSFMRNLKVLHAFGHCGIDQEGIVGLDLVKLNAGNNTKIKNVSYMRNLKVLHAFGHCGINQEGIAGLDLVELYAGYNTKINNVSYMRNLKVLYTYGNCGIDQAGIAGLDLVQLYTELNDKITTKSFNKS